MRLLDLVRNLPGVVDWVGNDLLVEGIRADSRDTVPGDVFVAVPGVNVDGHDFIGEAVGAGAVAVIGERPAEALSRTPGDSFSYVRVTDARRAWAWSCAAWEGFPSRDLTMIGVTGTDGKTTTVSLIHAILRAAGIKAGMMGTVTAVMPSAGARDRVPSAPDERYDQADTGLHTTTPDPPIIQRCLWEMVERGASHAVLEVTSHGLAQNRVAGCDFDVALITNVTHEHLDFHGSLQAYQRAKMRLFEGLESSYRKPRVPKLSILNRDDDSFAYLSAFNADRQITYSVEGDADVTADRILLDGGRTRFRLCVPDGCAQIETRLLGAYNVPNILAAAAACAGLQVPLDAISEGIALFGGVPGRMELVDEGQSFLAVVDFAHTPNALREALKAARDMIEDDGRVIVVFGSAGLRDREKRRLMGQVAGQLADVVVVTAEDPRTEALDAIMAQTAEAAQGQGKHLGENLFVLADRGEAILRSCELARPGDVVIACGKGHEQSMCFGTMEYPWDDREAMRLALRGKILDTLPTARPRDTE